MSDDKFSFRHSPLYTQNFLGEACHPDAPRGGGGFGRFVQAGTLGSEGYFTETLLHPLAPAAKFLTPELKTVPVKGASIDITEIPKIMDAQKWPKGAALMRRWLSRSARTLPDYDTPDENTITMEWALGFSRAKSVYEGILRDRIWSNSAAQKAATSALKANGFLTKAAPFSRRFGDFTPGPVKLQADHINYRTTPMSTIDLDDMDAALGRFTFYILIKGAVSSSDGANFEVIIDTIGVYIKDSYDFEGDQSLGYWDAEDKSASAFNIFSGQKVSNEDFRKWREANKRGGDFQVFSDIKEIKLTQPDKFTIKQ